MTLSIEMFAPEFLELNRELQNHEDIQEFCADCESGDIAQFLASIAGFFNIGLDGLYTHDDLVRLASILIDKMKRRRMPIILN